MGSPLDIAANRRARKWTTRELLGRVLWDVLSIPLFAWTPRPLWAWRRLVLRIFGARIGREVHVYPSVRIAIPWNISIGDCSAVGDGAILYSLGSITIGERVTISQYAHLCAGTHDHASPAFPLMKAPITIASETWVCADAFVGPGVTIGPGAIVGARAVAMRDVDAGRIVAGNPAKEIKKRQSEKGA